MTIDNASSVEKPDEVGTDGEAIVQRWKSEVELADKEMQPYMVLSTALMRRYRDERALTLQGRHRGHKDRRFNVFYANTQTILPTLYKNQPKPVVERTWRDRDPVARAGSQIMQRSLVTSLDDYDFHGEMKDVVFDLATLSRGQARVRYTPLFEKRSDTDENGDTVETEEVVFEDVQMEYVYWRYFSHAPARKWKDVRWVKFTEFLTRAELVERFGDIGKTVPLDTMPEDMRSKPGGEVIINNPAGEFLKKAEVWEIWNRDDRKVYFIAKEHPEPLDIADDPLELKNFFPCPKPLYGVMTNDSLIPIPGVLQYLDQADEMDWLTTRIHALQKSIKVRGAYAGEKKEELTQIFKGENTLVAVEGWAQFQEKGGLGKLIEWVPLDIIVTALNALLAARDKVKQEIFEISGISDVVRGATDPRETFGAQELKGDFASLRLQTDQDDVAEFARDMLRLKAEVIAGVFGDDTIRTMSGWDQLLTDSEPLTGEGVQSGAAAGPGQPGQPQTSQGQPLQPGAETLGAGGFGDPQLQMMQKRASHELLFNNAMRLLRVDVLRDFRVNVETDSTIAFDEAREREDRISFLKNVSVFMKEVVGFVQAVPEAAPLAFDLLEFSVRSFRIGRDLEESFETARRNLTEKLRAAAAQPDQGEGDGDQKMAIAQLRAELDQMKLAQKDKTDTRKLDIEEQRVTGDQQLEAQRFGLDVQDMQIGGQNESRALDIKASEVQRRTREDDLQLLATAIAEDGRARIAAASNVGGTNR